MVFKDRDGFRDAFLDCIKHDDAQDGIVSAMWKGIAVKAFLIIGFIIQPIIYVLISVLLRGME